MAGPLISLQSISYRCKAHLHNLEALAQCKTLSAEAMLIQLQHTFLLVRSLCEAVDFDQMELLTVSCEDGTGFLELDDITLPSAFHDAIIARLKDINNDATRKSVRSHMWWAERLVRYVVRAARIQAACSTGLTVTDRRRGPRALAPMPSAINVARSEPTGLTPTSPRNDPSSKELTAAYPTTSIPAHPIIHEHAQELLPATVGVKPLKALIMPNVSIRPFPASIEAINGSARRLPVTIDRNEQTEIELQSGPAPSAAPNCEAGKSEASSDARSASAPPEACESKQQNGDRTPAAETKATVALQGSQNIRVVREARNSYVSPQEREAVVEFERAIHRVWMSIAAAAIGGVDGTRVPQILTPPERGYLGASPSLKLIRNLLAIPQTNTSLSGESSRLTSKTLGESIPRSAAHLLRLDVPSAFLRYFEVTSECLEDLVVRGRIDNSALEQFSTELMTRVKPRYSGTAPDFSSISPSLGEYLVNGKPNYLKAVKLIRNSKRIKNVAVRRNRQMISEKIAYGVENGSHILIFNPAGAGKTFFMNSIEIGSGSCLVRFNAAQGMGQIEGIGLPSPRNWDQLLAEIAEPEFQQRFPKKMTLLVDECTFLTPTHLSNMHIFGQIIMVGDPCQLGAPSSGELIGDFMSRIDALIKTDGIVYRTRNPELFQLLNYIGYDGRFTALTSSPELVDYTFQIVNCRQHRLSKAVSIVLACIAYGKLDLNVIVASQDIELINLVDSIINDDIDLKKIVTKKIVFSLLSNLQGKETDVLIFDPSEVDKHIRDPYTAAKYLTMILGRATTGFCMITPEREVATSLEDLRPFSVMFSGCCQYCPPIKVDVQV